MEDIIKLAGISFAGGISLFAMLLLAKPLYDAFKPLADLSSVPVIFLVGLILLTIGAAIFQKIAGGM